MAVIDDMALIIDDLMLIADDTISVAGGMTTVVDGMVMVVGGMLAVILVEIIFGFCKGKLFFWDSVRFDGVPVQISPTGPLGEIADTFTLSLPDFRLSGE
jgi:hypothetical protein